MMGGYGIDITERKKLEQLKDEFIGLVSHELGSPLTVITGCLNTVLDEATNLSEQERSHLLRNAAKEADALSHLLGNLLELSRAQAERLFLHVELIETDIVARNVIEKITEQYPTYELLLDFPEGLPPVDADPLRVERILYNLLDNACKYSPKGSKVRVFAKPDKDNVIIGVSDQGVGIATSDREKIFQAFERLEPTTPGRAKGTGIGLLVCQRLVEAHGGRIWVESAPGKGSTFFFALPYKRER
jgi:signal transduction histidine kinase